MALLSLLFLLIAIFLGFFRHMNTGLLAIGFSLVLGRLNGIPDKEVINGFNYSLFMILLGVTYLFSLAQLNGSLELCSAGRKTHFHDSHRHLCFLRCAFGPGSRHGSDHGDHDGVLHGAGCGNGHQSGYAFSLIRVGRIRRRCVTAGSDRHYRYQSVCRLWTDRH